MIQLFFMLADNLKDSAKILYVILSYIPLLFFAALYVLHGIALTSLCRASQRGSVWMAWVPFANLYLLGLLADAYTDHLVLRGDVDAGYSPSTLRRKMLGFSIAEAATGAVVGAAWVIVMMASIAGFFTVLFGGFFKDPDTAETVEGILGVFTVSFLLMLVVGAICLYLHIQYLVSACKAYHRLFRMMDAPASAFWPVLLIFVPLLPSLPLLITIMKRRGELAQRFFPPISEPSPEADDGEVSPPVEPAESQADPTSCR